VPNPSNGDPGEVVISASIAYDYLMSFGGSLADHILPDKTHVISVSFLVDSLRRYRGGVGGNICYNLSLLGVRPTLVGAVGSDFGPYRAEIDELGIDSTQILQCDDHLTASAFMMADMKSNQIASFYPGPAEQAQRIDAKALGDNVAYALLGATGPETMIKHTRELGAASCKLIYDPAFQIILLNGEDLANGIDVAWAVIGNDYEFAMMERKTGLSVDAIAERCELVIVTYGEQGSELRMNGASVRVPAAPTRGVKDPTGAGDAYRAGLIKGLLLEQELAIAGRIAGLAAVHAVEHVGPQEHKYSPDEFVNRFDDAFPDMAGALTAEMFMRQQVFTSN
jgi:adenosine kinase